jgi:rRNA maturation RNase YbeY
MKGKIRFFTENISLVVKNKKALRNWILMVLEQEGKAAGDINYILCDDGYLLALNVTYLKHKTLTDILTFTFGDESGNLSGDIYISLPRVRENARLFKVTAENELHRVMIHGVLHLIGYEDSSANGKAEMRRREDLYLAGFSTLQNSSRG